MFKPKVFYYCEAYDYGLKESLRFLGSSSKRLDRKPAYQAL